MQFHYVHRDGAGKIKTLTNQPNGSTERLPDTHPDVAAFLNPPIPAPKDTELTPDDTERLFLSLGVTPAQIVAAKRNRP